MFLYSIIGIEIFLVTFENILITKGSQNGSSVFAVTLQTANGAAQALGIGGLHAIKQGKTQYNQGIGAVAVVPIRPFICILTRHSRGLHAHTYFHWYVGGSDDYGVFA